MNKRRVPTAFAVLTTLATLALPFAAPQNVHAATPSLAVSIRLQAQTLPRVPIDTLFTIRPRTAQGFVPIDAVVVVRDERPTPRYGRGPIPVMGNMFVVYLGCQSLCLSATGGALARASNITMHPIGETRTPLPRGRTAPYSPAPCVEAAFLSDQPLIGGGGSRTVLGPANYTIRVELHVFLHNTLPRQGLSGTVTLRPIVVVRALTRPITCGGIGGKVE
jgi:hypothetical protein